MRPGFNLYAYLFVVQSDVGKDDTGAKVGLIA